MNPLDQLADITTPNQVSIWPLAWGYWVIIVLTILCIAIVVASTMKHIKRNKEKKAAQAFIKQLSIQDPQYCQQIQNCLKHLCAHYFANNSSLKVAMLHGEQWHHYVKSKYKGSKLEELHKALLLIDASLYAVPNTENSSQTCADNAQIGSAINDWIEKSLPAKQAKTQSLPKVNNSDTKEAANV